MDVRQAAGGKILALSYEYYNQSHTYCYAPLSGKRTGEHKLFTADIFITIPNEDSKGTTKNVLTKNHRINIPIAIAASLLPYFN